MMGQDSYQKLPTWHRWLELLNYSHLLVVHRADREKTLFLHPEHEGKLVDIAAAPEAFAAQANGLISFLPISPPDISSTLIREQLNHNDETVITEIPLQVFSYIQKNHLY